MELVSFINIEDDPPDLILSFAIWQPELDDIRSLILLRTPEYEFILDETERGVKVSDEAFSDDEDDLLRTIYNTIYVKGIRTPLTRQYIDKLKLPRQLDIPKDEMLGARKEYVLRKKK